MLILCSCKPQYLFVLYFFQWSAKTLLQTTFTGKVFLKIKRAIKKMADNTKLTTKVVLYGMSGMIGGLFYIAFTGMYAMDWFGVFFWMGIPLSPL